MKRLLKAILVMMTSQVAVAAVGIVRNKLLAVILGPGGVGLFSQLQSLENFLANGVPMGMNLGALKYIAADRANNKENLATTVSTSAKTFGALSAVTVLGCLVFAKPLAAWALDDAKLWPYLVPAVLGVPLLIQSQLWLSYLRAGLEMKQYSATAVITSLIGLPIVIPLVLLWKEAGAAAHLLIVAVVGYIVARMFARRSMGPDLTHRLKSAPFDRKVLVNLVRFAGGNITVFAVDLAVPFIIRVQIIRDLGLDANGIYQVVFALSSQYLSMPMNAIGAYVYPRISQLTDKKEVNGEINNALKMSLLFCTSGILLVLLCRDVFISALFSEKFLPAVALVGWQLVGAYFRSTTLVLQYPMLPQERFRARIVINLLRNSIFMLVFYLPGAELRLESAVWAYAAGWLFECLAIYFYTHHTNGYTFSRRNKFLLTTSTAAVMVLAFSNITDPSWRMIGIGVVALWAVTSLNREDIGQIRQAVAERRARRAQEVDLDA